MIKVTLQDILNFNLPLYDNTEVLPRRNYTSKEILKKVYDALEEKGYNPINQIVGYIMSGDPTFITSYKNARSLIIQVERDELVEELLREYINNEAWNQK